MDEIHVAPNSETAPTTSTGPGIVGDVEPNLALSPTKDYFILGQSIASATNIEPNNSAVNDSQTNLELGNNFHPANQLLTPTTQPPAIPFFPGPGPVADTIAAAVADAGFNPQDISTCKKKCFDHLCPSMSSTKRAKITERLMRGEWTCSGRYCCVVDTLNTVSCGRGLISPSQAASPTASIIATGGTNMVLKTIPDTTPTQAASPIPDGNSVPIARVGKAYQ
ncbi:hypothetical protein B0T13DRAFT_443490 [Neurospora crassa]|nr:hypothetical protein B0T13DRAFT_443490 [Neurospora crassa]